MDKFVVTVYSEGIAGEAKDLLKKESDVTSLRTETKRRTDGIVIKIIGSTTGETTYNDIVRVMAGNRFPHECWICPGKSRY
jgi:hypothetical protein